MMATLGWEVSFVIPNHHALATRCQSAGLAMAIMASFEIDEIGRVFFIKYTWEMVFVLSSMCSATSKMLCESNDLGYNCDFSKSSQSLEFRAIHAAWTLYQYHVAYIGSPFGM